MVKIKLFGTLRLKTGFKETTADITSVKEAWAVLSEETGIPVREFKKCIAALNGQPCKASAKLSDGDVITLFSPSGGG